MVMEKLRYGLIKEKENHNGKIQNGKTSKV